MNTAEMRARMGALMKPVAPEIMRADITDWWLDNATSEATLKAASQALNIALGIDPSWEPSEANPGPGAYLFLNPDEKLMLEFTLPLGHEPPVWRIPLEEVILCPAGCWLGHVLWDYATGEPLPGARKRLARELRNIAKRLETGESLDSQPTESSARAAY